MDNSRIWYEHFTEDVAEKARTDELLQDLVLAVVHAAADFDMYATGKVDPENDDHIGSYEYFRDLIDRLGIPRRAIVDVINECFPYDDRENLTERDNADTVAAEIVTESVRLQPTESPASCPAPGQLSPWFEGSERSSPDRGGG